MDRPISRQVIMKRRIRMISTAVGVLGGLAVALVFLSNWLQSGVKASSLVFSTVDTGSIEAGVSAYGKVDATLRPLHPLGHRDKVLIPLLLIRPVILQPYDLLPALVDIIGIILIAYRERDDIHPVDQLREAHPGTALREIQHLYDRRMGLIYAILGSA